MDDVLLTKQRGRKWKCGRNEKDENGVVVGRGMRENEDQHSQGKKELGKEEIAREVAEGERHFLTVSRRCQRKQIRGRGGPQGPSKKNGGATKILFPVPVQRVGKKLVLARKKS